MIFTLLNTNETKTKTKKVFKKQNYSEMLRAENRNHKKIIKMVTHSNINKTRMSLSTFIEFFSFFLNKIRFSALTQNEQKK